MGPFEKLQLEGILSALELHIADQTVGVPGNAKRLLGLKKTAPRDKLGAGTSYNNMPYGKTIKQTSQVFVA